MKRHTRMALLQNYSEATGERTHPRNARVKKKKYGEFTNYIGFLHQL